MGEVLLTSQLKGERLELAASGSWTAAHAGELESLVDSAASQATHAKTVSIDMGGVRAAPSGSPGWVGRRAASAASEGLPATVAAPRTAWCRTSREVSFVGRGPSGASRRTDDSVSIERSRDGLHPARRLRPREGGGFADRRSAVPVALPSGTAGGRACEPDPEKRSRSPRRRPGGTGTLLDVTDVTEPTPVRDVTRRSSLARNWLYVLRTTNPPEGHVDPVSKWL